MIKPGLLIAFVLVGSLARAQDVVRPRIALVLGGGGARGAAHIGVLEELQRLRVPVDCVAGTSMGALISGAYAAGLSPAEMREGMANADWGDMFQDNPPYSEINYRNKALSRRFIPGSETGVSDNGVAYQGGVVSGQKIKLFFNRLVHSDLGEREIESLPLPLAIIATDIGNGDKVVLREGSLTSAMRASMSVPGLMAPLDYQGRKLVDGGLVDNVPIDEARSLCHADVVIAVNVGSPLMKAEDVGSLLTVSVQMVNILTEQNVSRSLATLKPTDIYIKPDLDGITAGDFQKSSETADRGRRAAEAVGERLRAFSVSETDYAAWVARIAYTRQTPPIVDEVQVAQLRIVNPEAVKRHLNVKAGDSIDDAQINSDMLRTYGDDWYESVDYALLNTRERNILRIAPVEKPWGPDYLRFGISLESSFNEDSYYTVRAAYDKTWINSLGGELLVTGEFGRRNGLAVDLYQPVEPRQRFFVEGTLSTASEIYGVYQDNQKLADYEKTRSIVGLGGGINVGLLGQFHAGWRQTWIETKLETGVAGPAFPSNMKASYNGFYSALDFDQMDRLYFPTRGWSSRLAYFDSPAQDYSKLNAQVEGAHSFGDYVLNAKLSYQGSPSGVLPPYDAASIGGFGNMAGFAQNQINGDNISYAGIRAEKIIGRLPLGLRGDMRAGISFEAARVGTFYTETQLHGTLSSTSIYLGGETPLGPVYLGYGRSNSGAQSVYLFIGTP